MTGGKHPVLYGCVTCKSMVSEEEVDFSNGGLPRCGDCVRKGLAIQWPNVGVNSSTFKSLTTPNRLRQLSVGYLESAISLCRELGEHAERLDWPRACVVYFCIHHAAELFLKACILLRARRGERLHHDLSRLQDRYCELYPELKDEYHIETPWDISPGDAEELFGVRAGIEEFESRPDQVFRYMTGKNLAGPRALHYFSPGTCVFLCERLRGDMDRVWLAVNKKERP
jgi:hypothetical protein